MAPTVDAALSLGSSLGDREGCLRLALAALRGPDVELVAASRLADAGGIDGRYGSTFLFSVVRVRTALPAEALVARLGAVERRLGQRPGPRGGDREIDLDLLLLGRTILRGRGGSVPHPRLAERPLLLELLYEVWPDAPNPWTGRPWREALPIPERAARVGVLAPLRG